MPSILNLKFKGNKSFVAFSNLNDTESLTKTWKVCTKVASFLEQGQRLENLSWRLWHLQNLMVDTDNAKSKREFKKLSKTMGDKLDKEKGRSIIELGAPDFKRNPSTDMIQQRAVEKERNREASQNAQPGTIKRMQFTFSVDQPTVAATSTPVQKPDLKPSQEFSKPGRDESRVDDITMDGDTTDNPPPTSKPLSRTPSSLHFPSLFSDDFGPAALLFPPPTLTTSMSYGEGVGNSASNTGFSIPRPTIELPLDDLITNVDSDSQSSWSLAYPSNSDYNANSASSDDDDESPQAPQNFSLHHHHLQQQHQLNSQTYSSQQQADVHMQNVSIVAPKHLTVFHNDSDMDDNDSDDGDSDYEQPSYPYTPVQATTNLSSSRPNQATRAVRSASTTRVHNSYGTRSNTPTNRPVLSVKTQGNSTSQQRGGSGPSATVSNANSAQSRQAIQAHNNTAPGGAKAECQNCGATHTPLWRRGLNDELNCNACGLYCKLHKRPRPKSMRNSHGEGRAQAAPRQETVDVMAQCYNCHTTATPLWRKDDEGKTVCNACGLYFKLHGSARPISMKSDVIRKRSRHDARRLNQQPPISETPSASPGQSRRTSPVREPSPTFAPDSTTQMNYGFSDESDYRPTPSELINALGTGRQSHQSFGTQHMGFNDFQFPGPFHPDYLNTHFGSSGISFDALPFAQLDALDIERSASPGRVSKRRRMSVDSASEPPSSAVSYSSYNSGYSTSTSSAASHSQRSSMDFPFNAYPNSTSYGPGLRGSANNAFWHPPMMPQAENSPSILHPPMLPPSEDTTMDYLHPPMLPPSADDDHEGLFASFLHPPMSLPGEGDSPSSASLIGNSHPPMWPVGTSAEFVNHLHGF